MRLLCDEVNVNRAVLKPNFETTSRRVFEASAACFRNEVSIAPRCLPRLTLWTKETYTAKLQHASLAMCKPTVSNVLAVCAQQQEQGLIKKGQKF